MSAGAVATMLASPEEAASARRLALGGAAAELILTEAMERRLDRDGVGAPYHQGQAGALGTAAKVLSATGAGVLAARGRTSRGWATAGGALLAAGALAERWAIFRAGFQSAARPEDTVDPQRARILAGEASGAARRAAATTASAAPSGPDAPGRRRVPGGSPAIDVGPAGTDG